MKEPFDIWAFGIGSKCTHVGLLSSRLGTSVFFMEPNHSIATAITLKIKEAGTNPNAVARAARIPRTTFDRKMSAGGLSLTVGELYGITQALNTTPAELLAVAA